MLASLILHTSSLPASAQPKTLLGANSGDTFLTTGRFDFWGQQSNAQKVIQGLNASGGTNKFSTNLLPAAALLPQVVILPGAGLAVATNGNTNTITFTNAPTIIQAGSGISVQTNANTNIVSVTAQADTPHYLAITNSIIDWLRGDIFGLTNGTATTHLTNINFTAATNRSTIIVAIINTSGTVDFPGVDFPGGASPVLTANAKDVFTIVRIGTNLNGSGITNFAATPFN